MNNHSTELALSSTHGQLIKNLKNVKDICSIFLDLRKAFDTVNHERLLGKLYRYFSDIYIKLYRYYCFPFIKQNIKNQNKQPWFDNDLYLLMLKKNKCFKKVLKKKVF